MRNEKSIIKNAFIYLLVISFIFHLSSFISVFAASSSNNNYDVEIKDIDTVQVKPQEIPKTLDTEKQSRLPIPVVTRETAPMSFSLSTALIDFGPLSPNNPTLRTNTLSIINKGTDYTIQASEDHPLKSIDNAVIADATCDNGACSEQNEALWASNLTYGFGFRCEDVEGKDCKDSANLNFYKQFANTSKHEIPQIIMTGRQSSLEKKGQITFKLNTSGTQKRGNYSNTVTLTAAPNY